jgi:ferredoxin--NADP+ reductase
MFQIVRTQQLTGSIFSTEIRSAPIAKAARPGQFVKVMVTPDSLPLPIPVAETKINQGTFTVVAEDKDEARRALKNLEPGASIADCTGPFGQPSRIESLGKVACIGVGIGAAVMLSQLREYRSLDCYTISIVGCPSKDDLFWADRIAAESDEHYVVTEDGSYGIKGRVTAVLRAVYDNAKDLDRVVVAGPLKLMKMCADFTRPLDIPTFINFSALISDELWREGQIRLAGDSQESFSFMEKTEVNGYLLDFETLLKQEKQHAEAQTKDPGQIPGQAPGKSPGPDKDSGDLSGTGQTSGEPPSAG